jgi:putative PIN family toxin of toxin-antitoxin system
MLPGCAELIQTANQGRQRRVWFDRAFAIRAIGIQIADRGNIRIDISDAILAETIHVLRDKFQWDGYSLQDAREKLRVLGNHVSPSETLFVIKEDPDDDRILECASTAKSDFIVSEDKDLLRLGQFGDARIVSIGDFINLALTPGKAE